MPRSKTLVTMTPAALEAFARKWCLEGFKLSGYGFHGEKFDVSTESYLQGLLLREFDRLYAEDGDKQ